jgi:hypothetical protein
MGDFSNIACKLEMFEWEYLKALVLIFYRNLENSYIMENPQIEAAQHGASFPFCFCCCPAPFSILMLCRLGSSP